MRLHHVQVACPRGGEAEARRFYGEALGMTEVDKPADLVARGGCWFRAYDDDGTVAAELHVGVEDPFAPATKAHPALSVTETELDALAERLQAADAPVTWDNRMPGVRRFYTADPFGNRLELLAAPGEDAERPER